LHWSQFVFVPGIRAALKQLATEELPMIVVSNQAAVGKGLLAAAGLENLTVKMQEALLQAGIPLAAAYYCIHRPDENCVCRKPKPALLFSAAADFNIDLSRSIFIGDSDTDAQAAAAAGCASVLFGTGMTLQSAAPPDLRHARRATELYAVVAKYLQSAEHL
jgi:D-glycero-D-manno-heptose 1,7-bisphosphate phosphatase